MSTEMLIMANVSLLGTNLSAGYKKDDKGFTILICPGEKNANTGISITDVVDDIKKLLGQTMPADFSVSTIQNKLIETNSKVDKTTFDFSKVILKLSALYIRYSEIKDGDSTKTTSEYALKLDILTNDFIPEELRSIFNVTSLSIALWNQGLDVKILNQLEISTDLK